VLWQWTHGLPMLELLKNGQHGKNAVVGPLDSLHGLRKYDGRPFRPIEIIEPVRRIAEVGATAEAL